MSSDRASLREQLQQALGSSYIIERELAGGGMSRVFVAEEMRFGRKVVVKVLAPELVVGLSAERFEREIRLAAQLQQANIVPLFGAGEAGAGIPYYTMPFVEGESLRARLDGRPFHPADAVAILRDVARALEYAHSRGVVHRDIKPENILLSGGTAVVTDFGIAKALSASKTKAPGGTLTTVGTSLGTPAYMAPEQAVGDDVDARADIYAWGVVAYEMLNGGHPFTGKQTAQQYITAHLAEKPKELGDARADVHPALSAVVMKALEKEPPRRFQNATELLRALNEVTMSGATTPTHIASVRRAKNPLISRSAIYRTAGVAALITLILGGIAAFAARQRESAHSPGSTATAKRVFVGDFQNRSGDAALTNIANELQEGISRRLTATNVAEVLASDDATAVKAGALARAKSIGAGILVTGSMLRVGTKLEFSADLIDPSSGRILRSVGPISAKTSDPSAGGTELRERVLGTIALMLDSAENDAIPAAASQTPLYDAFREFAAGENLARAADYAGAFSRYQSAYHLDSTFTFAAVRTARGYYNTGQCRQADSLAAVLENAARLSEYEKAVLDRTTARCKSDWVTAYKAAKRARDIAPESNDAQYVFAISALYLNRPAEALRGFNAISGGADENRFFYTAIAYHMLGKYADERVTAEQAEAGFPGTSTSYLTRINAFSALRDTIALRKVVSDASMANMTGSFSTSRMLEQAALEAQRFGLPRESLRIRRMIADLDNAVPGADRTRAYWRARAENEYDMRKYAEAVVSLDSADRRATAAVTTRDLRVSAAITALRGRVAARAGRHAEAEAALTTLSALSDPYFGGYAKVGAAQIAAALGDRDRAVRLMREAIVRGVSAVDYPWDATPDLVEFSGYLPYEELFKPRG